MQQQRALLLARKLLMRMSEFHAAKPVIAADQLAAKSRQAPSRSPIKIRHVPRGAGTAIGFAQIFICILKITGLNLA